MSTAPASASGAAQSPARVPAAPETGAPASASTPFTPSFDSVAPVPVPAPAVPPAVRIDAVSKRFGSGPVVLDLSLIHI